MTATPPADLPLRRVDARRARSGARRSARRARILRSTAYVATAILAALLVAAPLCGIKAYVITGGSMHGVIERGALILSRTVPVDSLRVGDIITYRPPDGSSALVTHRIVSIEPGTDGISVLTTKGDANEAVDPWRFTLDRPEEAKCVAQIPLVGYLVGALSTRIGRACLFALPALMVALWLLAVMWRRTGEAAGEASGEAVGQEATPGGSAPPTPAEQQTARRHPARSVAGGRQ